MKSSRTLLVVVALLAMFWSAVGLSGEKAGEKWKMEGFKKPSKQELRQALTPLQFDVTQEEATEPPFDNKYWRNKRAGIYVDVVSGEPLFSSLDKFDSGTGWPSFTRPLEAANIVERDDRKLVVKRVELRSKRGDSHLGHVFDDGPPPNGTRYCVNSAALRFVPMERLEEEGYGEYLALFATGSGAESPSERHAAAPGRSDARPEEVAILAGGCFWGVEEVVRKLPGVIDTEVGYTGGSLSRPGYQDVVRGTTGHAEAVKVVFDPRVLSYEALLGYFFRLHDPTTRNRQGNDIGTQYRSAVFYASEEQKQVAEQVRERVAKSGRWKGQIVTEIVKAGSFYPAEQYHQDYLRKNPGGYTCHYLRD